MDKEFNFIKLSEVKPEQYNPDKKCVQSECPQKRHPYKRWCTKHLESVRAGRMNG